MRRVVVTGFGVVSPLGIGWEIFWENLLKGESGIRDVSSFDNSEFVNKRGAEVKNFNPKDFISSSKIKLLGRSSQMAIAASQLAIKDSRIKLEKTKRHRGGVCIGTTGGEIGIVEKVHDDIKNGKTWDKKILPSIPSCSISFNVSRELKFNGVSMVFGTACSSGNYAIGYAYDLIKNNIQDYMLAGGADGFSRVIYTGFSRLLSVAPEKCQPFSKNRKGMIPGEGAGMVLLETLESAQKRKAKIYAEITGYGLSCDANDMTDPSSTMVACAIEKSLINSNIHPRDVSYISAHGTGTKVNDKAETEAYKKVFGDELKMIPVSSIKSMIGHTMGASSALEFIACALALDSSQIPPTINFEEYDPECDIFCVPNKSIKKDMRVIINNSQAFGGNNACLVLRKNNS